LFFAAERTGHHAKVYRAIDCGADATARSNAFFDQDARSARSARPFFRKQSHKRGHRPGSAHVQRILVGREQKRKRSRRRRRWRIPRTAHKAKQNGQRQVAHSFIIGGPAKVWPREVLS
jgi:hypothetical protein